MSQALTDGVKFTVPGRPATSGSKTGYVITRKDGTHGVSIVESCKKAKSHRTLVREAAREALGYRLPSKGAISLVVIFYMKRPKSHYRTGKYSGMLKDSAPKFHTIRPDATKMLRLVEDALTAVAYKDDSQVVCQDVMKVYAEDYSTTIQISEITHNDGGHIEMRDVWRKKTFQYHCKV